MINIAFVVHRGERDLVALIFIFYRNNYKDTHISTFMNIIPIATIVIFNFRTLKKRLLVS